MKFLIPKFHPWKWPLRARILWALLFCWRGRYDLNSIIEHIIKSDRIQTNEFRSARALDDRDLVLRHAARAAKKSASSLALEFGVYKGATLRVIAEAFSPDRVIGFDSFDGLPADWGELLPKGTFATDVPSFPEHPNISLEKGLIEKTLPVFLKAENAPVAFIHVDCDLYEVTKFILSNVVVRMPVGSVLVFDEYHGYPGFEEHEYLAWQEFRESSGVRAEAIAYSSHSCAFRIVENPLLH